MTNKPTTTTTTSATAQATTTCDECSAPFASDGLPTCDCHVADERPARDAEVSQ